MSNICIHRGVEIDCKTCERIKRNYMKCGVCGKLIGKNDEQTVCNECLEV